METIQEVVGTAVPMTSGHITYDKYMDSIAGQHSDNYQPNQTTFKAIVYMIRYPKGINDGRKYTWAERQQGLNRKYFDSFDWYYGKERKRIVDEQKGFDKLVKMIEVNFQYKYYTAFIVAILKSCEVNILKYKYNSIEKQRAICFKHTESGNLIDCIGNPDGSEPMFFQYQLY